MPRKLPWQTSSSTTVVRSKRSAVASTSIQKRQKVGKDISDSEGGSVGSSMRKTKARKEPPKSSSPPPSPPPESFMIDGADDDDKYRMVEDEFLTVAQRFTVHLHAAEYKRQQKMAKTQNADTISSISRPVTVKMPEQTKRKVEALSRAQAQKSVLEKLVGKKAGVSEISDDSDDGNGLPYFGTSLHGLMDSPREKSASLSKISSTLATRAAAGYRQPKSSRRTSLGSSQLRQTSQPSAFSTKVLDDDCTASSADDDDLDAVPKLTILERKPAVERKLSFSSVKKELKEPDNRQLPPKNHTQSRSSASEYKDMEKTVKIEPTLADDFCPPKPRFPLSRLERARRRRMKEEQEGEAKNRLDIIPAFL